MRFNKKEISINNLINDKIEKKEKNKKKKGIYICTDY